MMVITGRVL